ncbi:HelD family protein [Thermohalobacter berrensis]|uniref:HelD family protein n=1 Tax=Thermohalobacter berrensis TaxID=99594 RepID=UPI000E7104B7|nr:AAA family ATPase [Thermohalobacter berrensis]
MSVKEHPDYKEEVERLEYTKEYIEKVIKATDKYRDTYKKNIKQAMIELDPLDSSQSYINIILNTKFMEIADRNYDNLTRVRKKPYFARVDFRRKGEDKVEKVYIGKTSLMRAEDDIPLIVDWRSPIANIYYEGRLGEVMYRTEEGIEEGNILLKRQFTIEDDELANILDIDITTNDAFLQESLDVNVDNKLKDIASTIQAEQNRVIRADIGKPLIVQGVAGSGKTTIALHRIAYFIYRYEKTFDPENFMIIAPNKLFINYISEVLPELGVENVKQTTFIDFMKELVEIDFEFINKNEILKRIIKDNKDRELDLMKWLVSFKGSLDFKEIIDNYIKDIEDDFLPKEDFKLDDYTIVTYDEIKTMFTKNLKYLPLYKRIDKIKNSLSNRLKHNKNNILKKIQEEYDEKIEDILYTMEASEERKQKISTLADERDTKLKDIKKKSRSLVRKFVSEFPKKKLLDYYIDLITDKGKIKKYSNKEISKEKVNYFATVSDRLYKDKKIQL